MSTIVTLADRIRSEAAIADRPGQCGRLEALAAEVESLFTWCDHDSQTGDEGPVNLLGRWPRRWKCDGCGAVLSDAPEPHVSDTERIES